MLCQGEQEKGKNCVSLEQDRGAKAAQAVCRGNVLTGAVVKPLLGVPSPSARRRDPSPVPAGQAQHRGVGVPRMDGIPGVDAVLAIIWGLLPTVPA